MNTALHTDRPFPPSAGNHDDNVYDAFVKDINQRFYDVTAQGAEPLFTVDTSGLWMLYLASFPEAQRQYHNCHCCRQFIERFGGLVTLNAAGERTSAVWDYAINSTRYGTAVRTLRDAVMKRPITGVHISDEKVWGTPKTGVWKHYALVPLANQIHKRKDMTAYQAAAAKLQDFEAVDRALISFSKPVVEQALALLRSGALYRGEHVLGQAEWLHELHCQLETAGTARTRIDVIWHAVAKAPAGFCHPRSSMIGTLLDDLTDSSPHVKVSEASGPVLDWMVAKCLGHTIEIHPAGACGRPLYVLAAEPGHEPWVFRPSDSWHHGGPIIEQAEIHISPPYRAYPTSPRAVQWFSYCTKAPHLADGMGPAKGHGPTPLVAAMRCFVVSKLGDEVDVPKELT